MIARGHCGFPLFASEDARQFLVTRAARVFRESGATCLAWAILVNHYHVLVRCEGPPGPTFARLNTAIAWRVSRDRGERGAVFQNRFHSGTCDDESSLLARFAYVLGNPVHHRIVPTVEALYRYRWSGLGEVLGLREAKWADPSAALAAIHPDPMCAKSMLLDVLERKARAWAEEAGDPDEDRPDPEAELGEGARNLVAASQAAAPQRSDEPLQPLATRDLVRSALFNEGWTPASLLDVVCPLTGADPVLVASGMKTAPEAAARALIACVACDAAGASLADASRALGVGPSSLARARLRGRGRLEELGLSPYDLLLRSREEIRARSGC